MLRSPGIIVTVIAVMLGVYILKDYFWPAVIIGGLIALVLPMRRFLMGTKQESISRTDTIVAQSHDVTTAPAAAHNLPQFTVAVSTGPRDVGDTITVALSPDYEMIRKYRERRERLMRNPPVHLQPGSIRTVSEEQEPNPDPSSTYPLSVIKGQAGDDFIEACCRSAYTQNRISCQRAGQPLSAPEMVFRLLLRQDDRKTDAV